MNARDYLEYRLMRIQMWYHENFGIDYFGAFRFFFICVLPKTTRLTEREILEQYNTNFIWSLGNSWLILRGE